MAISNYDDLKAAVANWLGRADLTARIPDFIALAEADIGRNLRRKVTVLDSTLAGEPTILPVGSEVRLIRYNTDTRKYALTQVTFATLADLRRAGTGVPQYYAIADGRLYIDVTPSTPLDIEIVYFAGLTPLSDSNATNSTLTSSPDIYLFGTLKEAELYLEHDARNPLWTEKYRQAVHDENIARERAELSAAPLVSRLPVVFG